MSSLTNPLSFVTSDNNQFGTVGLCERKDHIRISYANGMNTKADKCAMQAMKISTLHGFNNVHFAHDPTEGVLKDIFVAAQMMVFNIQTDSVKKLTALWQKLFAEMGGDNNPDSRIVHYAHSRGGLVTELAFKNLTEAEKKKMIILSFGSPAIFDESVHSVNVLNTHDPIPRINPRRWLQDIGVNDFAKNDHLVESSKAGMDHGFLNTTYQKEIAATGEAFLERIL